MITGNIYKQGYIMLKQLLFIAILSALLFSCQLNQPQIPSWDTEVTLILPTQKVILSDVIKEDSVLIADTTADNIPIFSFSVSDSTEWQNIARTDLFLGAQQSSNEVKLGEFEVKDSNELNSDSVMVTDILPPELLAAGDTLPPYDPFTVSPPDPKLTFDTYQRISIASGSIQIVFHNQMFLTINPGMQIDIYDNGLSGAFIGSFVFNQSIPSGTTVQSEPLDLAGKEISNLLRLHYTVPIAGSDSVQILTDALKNGFFYTSISFNQLKVAWADAKVPQQSFSDSDSIDISQESNHLRQASISDGTLHLTFNNHLALHSHLRMTILDILKNNVPQVVEADLPPNQQTDVSIDLSGSMIENHLNPNDFVNALYYTVEANMDSSDGYVRLSAEDFISVEVQMDSLFFDYIAGQLDTIDVDIAKNSLDNINLFGDFDGDVRLNDLTMTLSFENQIDFPINVNLAIAGYHENNLGQVTDSVVIHIQRTIEAASVSPVTKIVLDNTSTTPSIVDLLEILPTRIKVSGSAFVNGDGSVHVGQGLRVLYDIESPLSFEIKTPLVQRTKIDTMRQEDMDADFRKALTKDIHNAFIDFEFSNGLPLGTHVVFYLADTTSELYNTEIADSSRKFVLEVDLNAGQIGDNGYVSEPSVTKIHVNLSEQKLAIFKQATLYSREDITIQPTQGQIRIRQNDELQIGGKVHVKYMVNVDEQK